MCLYKKQSEIAIDKFVRTTKELNFKQAELDAVISGVKIKQNELHKADEKLDKMLFITKY